jgi:predicted RNase H-like HicB family nuclease
MILHLGVEDMEPGNWVVWVFELPGCYARGSTRDLAISLAPAAVTELTDRLKSAGFEVPGIDASFEFVIEEEFRAFPYSPDYLVNAFFENDKSPLTAGDIEYALWLLGLNRRDFLNLISDLSNDILDKSIEGEAQKSIRGIIRHVGTAEWWYWDRLGLAFPRENRPEDIFQLLPKVRDYTLHHIPELVESGLITERSGETWSPRKLLRRTVWHERVHTLQISRYLQSFSHQ